MSKSAVLTANLAALAKIQPSFQLPTTTHAATVTDQGCRLMTNGRAVAIHSRDPQLEADRTVASLLDPQTSPTLIVVIGLGLGYLLEALQRRNWSGKVLALEPEPSTVRLFLERCDWQHWIRADRLRLLVAPEFAGASDCWRLIPPTSPNADCVITHPVFVRERATVVTRARDVLEKIRFDAEANRQARRKHGAQYLLNTLRNLPQLQIAPSASALDGIGGGLPVIIAAAGPSLDAALPMLRESQSSALLIAVDTALRPLLQGGITPHLVVAVDPGENNARHLVDLPHCPGTYLVAEASVDPVAFETFGDRTFLFSVSNHEPWSWLREQGCVVSKLRAWGSVLTSAFDLALRTGADPIVFVGADLAFSGDRPYCRGTAYEEDWQREVAWGTPLQEQWSSAMDQWPLTHEPDVASEPVRTAPQLIAFRNWLVDETRRHPGRRFVNATGAGAFHGGTLEQLSPAAALTLFGSTPHQLAAMLARRRRDGATGHGPTLHAAAARLHQSLVVRRDAEVAPINTWRAFADGLTVDTMRDGLAFGLRLHCTAAVTSPRVESARATAASASTWLPTMAEMLPLEPLLMPSHRLRLLPNGARQFRFRSHTARIVCCAVQLPAGAVCEDGQPLSQAADLDHIIAGSYSICRDEVHFRASDGSDPRTNGRHYTVLVPTPVASVESLPLAEILERQL